MSFIFMFVLSFCSVSCENNSDKQIFIDKINRLTASYHNTRFSGIVSHADETLQPNSFEVAIGSSRNDFDLVFIARASRPSEPGDLITEAHSRQGVEVQTGDFVEQSNRPPFFRGNWAFDCQRYEERGLDLAFGVVSFGSNMGIDLCDRAILENGQVEVDEYGEHFRIESRDVTLRMYFLGTGGVLSRVQYDFDGLVDEFTGGYGEDGRAIVKGVQTKERYCWADIQLDGEQVRRMQLYYDRDGQWIPTSRVIVEEVVSVPGDLPKEWVFKNVRTPEFDVVVFSNEFGRYALRDGQLVQVFDATAYRVLSDLLGRELELPQDRKVPFHLEDYLRKFPSNHCGVYSVLTAVAALQSEPKLDNLFSPQQIRQTSGSSAADLVDFLQEHGLQAKVYSGASADFLKKVAANGDAAILHFRHSYKQEGEHWATFLGMTDDDKARIVDLPRSPEYVAIPDLMTDWDGIVIVASKRPVDGYAVASFYQNTAVWVVSALVVLGVVQLVVSRLRRRRGWHSTAAMLTAVALTAVMFEAMNPHGLYANPEVTGVVIGRYFQYVPDTIQRVDFPENAVFVDARTPEDFRRKHIPGAFNLPVDFSVGELRAFTQQHADRDQPIVVYCAHAQCGWATNLSRRLVALGYRDIKVYEPGLVGYYTEETM